MPAVTLRAYLLAVILLATGLISVRLAYYLVSDLHTLHHFGNHKSSPPQRWGWA